MAEKRSTEQIAIQKTKELSDIHLAQQLAGGAITGQAMFAAARCIKAFKMETATPQERAFYLESLGWFPVPRTSQIQKNGGGITWPDDAVKAELNAALKAWDDAVK